MFLRQINDSGLAQYAYLIGCPRTSDALVIDPERDIDRYRLLAEVHDLRIVAVAETHIHADFVSGAQEFAVDPSITLYLSGEGGEDWTYRWPRDRDKVVFLRHNACFHVGSIDVIAIHTPGHTPEHLSFLITDRGAGADAPIALATGDFLFVGDVGRPDLLETAAGVPGARQPAAKQLQKSLVERLDGLPDFLQVLPAHGSGSSCGKALSAIPFSVLGYERRFNRALRLANTDPAGFIEDILSGQPDPPLYFARMKKVNRDGISVTGVPPRPRKLMGRDTAAFMAGRRGKLLDTRPDRVVFDAGHPEGALHAPYPGAFFLACAGSYVAEDDQILLLVEREADVEEMSRQLYRIGLDHVAGYAFAGEIASEGLMTKKTRRVDFATWNHEALGSEEMILDVRNASEFAEGHLGGAVNVPYTRLKPRLDELPRHKRLYIHCGSGKRAALAASFLRQEGFDVLHVDGLCQDCERIARARGYSH
ncbi:MAG TPA: MBL fold metallo-hydrolase [Terrimicrobiaceae bacterium]